MKRLSTILLSLCFAALAFAQAEGPSYYLPQTALRFTLQIEKTQFTPGELADYAKVYFHQGDEVLKPRTAYRIINMAMESYGVPDSAKHFTAKVSPKMSIQNVYTDNDGMLLSVNEEPDMTKNATQVSFANTEKSGYKAPVLNARDFMSEEILSVGSKAKMAQLCAKEIYNIRAARDEITRGQAETLPKDGEQLRLMMASMDKQEKALSQLFTGVTTCDTTIEVLTICADKEIERYLLFRFSDVFGMCDADDLSGAPYYINIKDLHKTPEDTRTEKEKAAQKDLTGLFVNVPGRAKVSVFAEEKLWTEKEYAFAQFGRTENVSSALFNKKVFTTYHINPSTGAMTNMKSKEVDAK